MTTFAAWLSDQGDRQDAVGAVARLWKEISPGRVHGLAGVTKCITDHSDATGLTWTQEAMRLTTEEFRAWKRDPAGSSIHAPAVATQLDRIEHMLRSLCDSLGIPLLAEVPDGPDAQVLEVTDATTGQTQALPVITPGSARVPHIGPAGLEMRPVQQLGPDGQPVLPFFLRDPAELADAIGPDGKPDWAKLYSFSDHEAPEEAAE
jgi:hypothetical protein